MEINVVKKTKTKNNILLILSAIIGVVFALITGFTYCATSLNLSYGQIPNSTEAYMANQQYTIINDTVKTPVLFGEGYHNFEVALQYSIGYSFDVRFKYSLSWSGGSSYSTDNVILHFANRDNVIYDDNYIFLANAVSAGNSKINIIASVDFVDPTDSHYFGQKLTINIEEVKIYKEQSSYDANHELLKTTNNGVNKTVVSVTGPASQAWLQYKENSNAAEEEQTQAYVFPSFSSRILAFSLRSR